MAIITCPHCNNKISDKAPQCPHCQIGVDTDETERERLLKIKKVHQIKTLSVQSMMALVLAMAGFAVMYFDTPEPDSIQMTLARVAFAAGFIWYVVNRIRHFILKNKGK